MDPLLSIILLIVLLPVFLIIFVIYLIHGELYFFFIQKRIGCNEIPFQFYKFKTLSDDISKPPSEREFFFGKLLRKSSLDELPQLINILKRDMSFVGPRPLPLEYLPYFNEAQIRRFKVKPGLTGWAQVNGRTSISWDEKLKLDVAYVEHASFWFDLKILSKTLKVLLLKSNNESLDEISFIDYCELENKKSNKLKIT